MDPFISRSFFSRSPFARNVPDLTVKEEVRDLPQFCHSASQLWHITDHLADSLCTYLMSGMHHIELHLVVSRSLYLGFPKVIGR